MSITIVIICRCSCCYSSSSSSSHHCSCCYFFSYCKFSIQAVAVLLIAFIIPLLSIPTTLLLSVIVRRLLIIILLPPLFLFFLLLLVIFFFFFLFFVFVFASEETCRLLFLQASDRPSIPCIRKALGPRKWQVSMSGLLLRNLNFKPSYHNPETLLLAIYLCYGNLINVNSLTATQSISPVQPSTSNVQEVTQAQHWDTLG